VGGEKQKGKVLEGVNFSGKLSLEIFEKGEKQLKK
jgi:hypothetical protein